MLEDIGPAPAAVREAVRRHLVEAGCPPEVASRLAAETTAERQDGGTFICLMGACAPPGDKAVESLVENVLDDNAEANDRAARGKRGYESLWPLPDRNPRRG